MKLLIFGKNGQLGWELQRSLLPLGQVFALGKGDQTYSADFTQPAKLAETIDKIKPDVIVNAAAYTAVDKAESDSANAQLVNADSPRILAAAAKEINALLVHYSTDYVFDGSGDKPWLEDDATNPLSVYGQTKLEGENAIRSSGCQHLIFRTSWVYGARGNNFAKIMLKLAQEREQLNIVSDQIGAPTGAELLADISAHAINKAYHNNLTGTYHLTADGQTSWYEYAQFVLDFARFLGVEIKVPKQSVLPIPTQAYPTPAQRPLNSRLNTDKLKNVFNLTVPNWQLGVERMLTEIYGK